MEYPKRKPNRLQNYDYSENGAYFITICTQNKQCLFGDVGVDSISTRMIANIWEQTMLDYQNVYCDKYVVMPNHFHAILCIKRADMESAPTISDVLQNFKRHTTVEYIRLVKQGLVMSFDKKLWQRSYHDHIIRNRKEYLKIWQYIDTNPLEWELDCYYKGD
ncbi:transposase [Chakrabartyella piscis]|uniref:transposase n=1 Tax=Chakrabartyella piscis TaxID=2918914 RepID=UPI0029584187|nr:transposase [Chakrabartyella piscis]